MSDDISNTKGYKHMVIHVVYNIFSPSVQGGINSDEIVFCLTLLSIRSQPMDGYDRFYVEHSRVMAYIFKKMTNHSRFLFSTVKAESVGPNLIS